MKAKRTHKNIHTYLLSKDKRANHRTPNRKWQNLSVFILFVALAFTIGKVELENIYLYKYGQTTRAFVYRHTSKSRRGVSLYEFKVDSTKYTGHDSNSEVGNFIDIVYLPQNPKINRNAKVINQDWCVWLYRKITE